MLFQNKNMKLMIEQTNLFLTYHLSNIYNSGELDENSTCANFARVADNGKTYNYKYYSLRDLGLRG